MLQLMLSFFDCSCSHFSRHEKFLNELLLELEGKTGPHRVLSILLPQTFLKVFLGGVIVIQGDKSIIPISIIVIFTWYLILVCPWAMQR